MTKEQAVERFIKYKNYRRASLKRLSKDWKISWSDLREAKTKAQQILKGINNEPSPSITHSPVPFKAQLPKVLLLDVETAPIEAYVWRLWKENIGWNQVVSQWYMLCWSAKWLYSNDTISACLTPEEALAENDTRIMQELWKLVDEANIIVAHNAKNADVPWMNTRFILDGLTPPSPYTIIDTLEIARKNFAFSSNKLDALAEYFEIEHKINVDFELWRECRHGNKKALEDMVFYNKKDVDILEQVFLKLRPWIKSYPNVNNYVDSQRVCCATCGSDNLEEITNNFYYTSTGKYTLYRCKDCGAITRGRYNLRTPKNIKAVSVAR